ncbi:MAG: DUF2779 domain-containing protein [Gemmatimonadales bacterium]
MRTLSKSDFKLARSCVTKLYYREHDYPQALDDNPYLALLAEGGYMVEQLARLMYPAGIELEYGRDPAADWATARRHLEAADVTLFEATLLSGRKLARVDILVKRGSRFDLIEVKSKSMDGDDLEEGPEGPFRGKRKPHAIRASWRPYLEDVAYQTQLLHELYPDAVIVPHLLVVDRSKITTTDGLPAMFNIARDVMVGGRKKDLDVRFIGDPATIVPGEFLTLRDVSSEVAELMPEIAAETRRFVTLYEGDQVRREPSELNWQCRDCEFRLADGDSRGPNGYRECWGKLADPVPHIFDLYHLGSVQVAGERLGNQLIAGGHTSLYEVPVDLLTTKRSPRQLVQIEYSRGEAPWIGPALAPALAALRWPLHFIDFETSLLALPYHSDMHPYEPVAFQWSCHALQTPDGVPEHREWLNTVDAWPSGKFLAALREAVGDEGSILTWSAYEGNILKRIRQQLERYGLAEPGMIAWIDAALERVVDLHRICVDSFFHPRMRGRTSIKVVLDALWKVDAPMRQRYTEWMQLPADPAVGPYEGLPSITIQGRTLDVADGTGAMQAYTAMLYGAERHDAELRDAWRALLLRYCRLDTMAMVLIWDYWRRNLPI